MPARSSDRWLTPSVLVVLIVSGTVVVLGVLAAVTYLTARGFDPQPIVQLAGTLVGATAALGTFVQGLATRRTTAKVERNTGLLGSGVGRVVDELDAQRGRHAATDRDQAPEEAEDGPVAIDPATIPHPLMRAAPAPPGR